MSLIRNGKQYAKRLTSFAKATTDTSTLATKLKAINFIADKDTFISNKKSHKVDERKRLFPNKSLFSKKYIFSTLAVVTAGLVTVAVLLIPIDTQQLVKLGYAGIFLVNLLGSITVIFPTPAILAAFAGGVFLNPIWAGLLAGLGSGLGEINGYMAGYGGKAVIEKKELYERIRPWITRNGFITLFILAAIPNPLFDLAGITAGTMGYPFFKFVVATCLGKIFKGLALAFLGLESSKLLGPLLR